MIARYCRYIAITDSVEGVFLHMGALMGVHGIYWGESCDVVPQGYLFWCLNPLNIPSLHIYVCIYIYTRHLHKIMCVYIYNVHIYIIYIFIYLFTSHISITNQISNQVWNQLKWWAYPHFRTATYIISKAWDPWHPHYTPHTHRQGYQASSPKVFQVCLKRLDLELIRVESVL